MVSMKSNKIDEQEITSLLPCLEAFSLEREEARDRGQLLSRRPTVLLVIDLPLLYSAVMDYACAGRLTRATRSDFHCDGSIR